MTPHFPPGRGWRLNEMLYLQGPMTSHQSPRAWGFFKLVALASGDSGGHRPLCESTTATDIPPPPMYVYTSKTSLSPDSEATTKSTPLFLGLKKLKSSTKKIFVKSTSDPLSPLLKTSSEFPLFFSSPNFCFNVVKSF